MLEFPHIEQLHNLVKYCQACGINQTIYYAGKIKLDGSNCGVTYNQGSYSFQSRTTELCEGRDYKGFVEFITSLNLTYTYSSCHITFYGEWCGPGIQKGTGCTQLAQPIFAIFMAYDHANEEWIFNSTTLKTLSSVILGNSPRVVIIEEMFSLNFNPLETSETELEEINRLVTVVEAEDPWLKTHFNISGTGEGIVWYPLVKPFDPNLMFKTKGEKHREVPIKATPTVVQGIPEFLELCLTATRLQQGADQIGRDKKLTGRFLKWISEDVERECREELAASGLKFSDVQSQLQTKAREWYFQNL